MPDMRRRFALSALPIGNIAQNQKQKVDHAETPAGKRRWIAHVHTCCVPQRKYKNVYKLYKPYTNRPTNRLENLYKLYKL